MKKIGKHDSSKNPTWFQPRGHFSLSPKLANFRIQFPAGGLFGCRESVPRGISNLDIRSANFLIMDKVSVREDDIVYIVGTF